MKNKKRHIWLYKVLFVLFRPFAKWKLRFTCEKAADLPSPALILSNHVTDWDPFLVGLSFKEHMYYVASEHVYRWGLVSKLLKALFAPIVRVKGKTDARTGMEVIRTLRRGSNVCLFAEGNRTFSGVTMPIIPATGKLARSSGAAMVTYRLEGGYFTSPRWSRHLRKGKMYGHVVNVYTPEQLKAMTPEEINRQIEADLYEDAYARQRQNPIPYTGRALAESLETTLYLCPVCHKAGTLTSSGRTLQCGCGLHAIYTEYGSLESEQTEFTTITEWDRWQKTQVPALVAQAGSGVICADEAQELHGVTARVGSEVLCTGQLALYTDRFVCGERVFKLDEISDLAIVGQMTLTFSTVDGAHYEIKSKTPRSALKYQDIFKYLRREDELTQAE